MAAVDELLKTAQPPRRLSDNDIGKRAMAICADIREAGGTVSKDHLRPIVAMHGMPYAAVGRDVGCAGYLERRGRDVGMAAAVICCGARSYVHIGSGLDTPMCECIQEDHGDRH
ncbi:hypothetical protein HY374_00020 [Candidatus Berkelbacteria bacterium]|nr:hypothetical protein [Candidatus Berkelbacteria bacterium]